MNLRIISFFITAVLATLFLFIIATPSVFASDEKDLLEITDVTAGKYALYAMMSSNAYHKADRIKFPLELLGWKQVDLNGDVTESPTGKSLITGFAYDIYEKTNSNEVVFAFRGTDDKKDWPIANLIVVISPQYKQATKRIRKYIEAHPDKKITVTGHSLGGGIALGVSARFGIDAFTFDPSPRIFDGIGDKHKPATRVVVYQKGEPLEFARKHWKKILEVVLYDNTYCCKFDFNGVSNHRSDYLAKGLLDLGVKGNPELKPVYDAIFGKPSVAKL